MILSYPFRLRGSCGAVIYKALGWWFISPFPPIPGHMLVATVQLPVHTNWPKGMSEHLLLSCILLFPFSNSNTELSMSTRVGSVVKACRGDVCCDYCACCDQLLIYLYGHLSSLERKLGQSTVGTEEFLSEANETGADMCRLIMPVKRTIYLFSLAVRMSNAQSPLAQNISWFLLL